MQPIKHEEEGIYRFDVFRLDPTRRLLLKDGQAVQLTPKTFDTLLALVRHRGRLMEKDELMQLVWPDTIVEETNLAHNISTLRKIFGQKGGENRFIVTVPGRGYSFVAEVHQEPPAPRPGPTVLRWPDDAPRPRLVTEADGPPAAPAADEPAATDTEATPAGATPSGGPLARPSPGFYPRLVMAVVALAGLAAVAYLAWPSRPAPATPLRAVAVLPFKPLVADHRDEVLEMGIADSLITRLSSLKPITVRPITAVRRYTALDQDAAAAGRELQVQAVLEGHIQKVGNKLRITARLVRVADGEPLWTRQFDEPWTDIFAVQDAIAQRVTGDLMGALAGAERGELAREYTSDPEAYQLYLTGRYHWNKRSGEGIRKSIEFFRQAIARDPNYALAYVGLADALATLGSYHLAPPREVVPQAREAAEQALRIDERLGEAHASMGKIINDYYWDSGQAESEFRRALELKPNYPPAHHWYSTYLVCVGQFDEALREARRALELDPLSPVAHNHVTMVHYWARRYEEGISAARQTLDLEPNFVVARFYMSLCYAMLGRHEEALAEAQKGRAMVPDNPDFLALLGYVSGRAGRRDEARRYGQELEELARRRYVPPFNRAGIPSGLGDMDEVFRWLEKCYEERDPSFRGLKMDPLFDLVRQDPRFADLVRRAGFEP